MTGRIDLFVIREETKMTDGVDLVKQESNDEKGATLVEYALLVALIAVIAIAAIRFVGTSVSTQFSAVASQI